VGKFQGLIFVFHQAVAAGHDGHTGRPGHAAGRVLVPQPLHGLGRGTDEVDVAAAADLVEVGILGQESVTGVDGLDVAHLGGADHAINLQVAVRALRRSHTIGFVRQVQIGAAAIGLAVNGDGLDAQLATGANDAKGDFAPIGD